MMLRITPSHSLRCILSSTHFKQTFVTMGWIAKGTEGQQDMTTGIQETPSPNMPLWHPGDCAGTCFLWTLLIYLKTHLPKRTQLSPPQEFHQTGKIDFCQGNCGGGVGGRGIEATPYPDIFCHQLSQLPSILRKAHPFFLKLTYPEETSISLLRPLSLFLVLYLSLKFKVLSLGYSFFPEYLSCVYEVHMFTSNFLLLIWVLLQGS